MKILKAASSLILALGVCSAQAAPHDKSLEACRTAAMEAVGEADVRLSDLTRRGRTYDFWLSVTVNADGDAEKISAYCKAKGDTVLDLVTKEGTWDKSSKRKVAREAAERVAKN